MMRRETLDQYCDDNDLEMRVMDGLDEAIVGFAQQASKDAVAVYSYGKILSILQRDMSYDDAVEHFEFNIAGAWVGESTPMVLYTEDDLPGGDNLVSDGATV
jgi:hypothetical protein